MEPRVARRRAAAEVRAEKEGGRGEPGLLEARTVPVRTSTLVSRLLELKRAHQPQLCLRIYRSSLSRCVSPSPWDSAPFARAAGGLGWSLGAALGAQMAAPDREVIAMVGDGATLSGSPLSAAARRRGTESRRVIFVVFDKSRLRACGAPCDVRDDGTCGFAGARVWRNRSSASAPKCILKRRWSRWPKVTANALKSQRSSPRARSSLRRHPVASDVRQHR